MALENGTTFSANVYIRGSHSIQLVWYRDKLRCPKSRRPGLLTKPYIAIIIKTTYYCLHWYSEGQTYWPRFSGLKIHLHTYNQSMFPFIKYMGNDNIWQNTNVNRENHKRAWNFFRPRFPSIFCWYIWYFISETYNVYMFRTQIALYNQCSSLLLLMVWRYNKRKYTTKHWHWENWASGASELTKFSHFYILKLLFLSRFCWYFRYFVDDRLFDKFPNVPTLRKSITGGGGGAIAPPPPLWLR